MKRDWNLIREIYLRIEECENPYGFDTSVLKEDYSPLMSYQITLLKRADLLFGETSRSAGCLTSFYNLRITLAGHEFLDKIRTLEDLEKAKLTLKERPISVYIDRVSNSVVNVESEVRGTSQTVTKDKP